MKKLILLALLAASTQSVRAQSIAAGTISLGGSIGYSQNTNKETYNVNNTANSFETKSSEFRFSPAVGYFVADNLAIGLELGYTAYRRPYTSRTPAPATVRAELDPTTVLRVGPYVQYYKMLSEQFGILGTLGGGYQNVRQYDYSGNGGNALIAEQKASGLYAALTPGIIFFPVPKFGISASLGSLGYSRLNYDYPTNSGTKPNGYEESSSTLGASFGFNQLQFGGTLYLGR